MLPLRLQTMSPLILDKTRLLALSSGSTFGELVIHDEHLMAHLNNFVQNLGNESIHQMYGVLRHRDFPELTRHRTQENERPMSDILLRDTNRQHMGITERYRKFLPSLFDIRKISEPSTKVHISMSRGYERHLIDSFSRLDAEAIDRSNIKPI